MVSQMQQALGSDWERLAPAIKKHYSWENTELYKVVSEGSMETIYVSWITKLLTPFFRPIEALLPFNGQDVKTILINSSKSDKIMHWRREFYFKDKPIIFYTKMLSENPYEITDYLKYIFAGIAKLKVMENGGIEFTVTSYKFKLGKISFRFSTLFGLGKGIIYETPLTDNSYRIDFELRHPVFGRTLSYKGNFRIV